MASNGVGGTGENCDISKGASFIFHAVIPSSKPNPSISPDLPSPHRGVQWESDTTLHENVGRLLIGSIMYTFTVQQDRERKRWQVALRAHWNSQATRLPHLERAVPHQ
ncbi:uncharacterized protein LOC116263256 [Nymphaea colorata]|nr:uncharacterized protein LOC116263256 [Nymphaea colorata]